MKFQALENSATFASNLWKSIAVGLLAAQTAGAEPTNDPSRYVLSATNIINEQLFAIGSNIEIAGTITDDAIIGAVGTAKITGTISNDLWIGAAQGIEMRGRVGDHARLASITVLAAGVFDRDLFAFGNIINLSTNNVVSGDVDLRGKIIALEGVVHGDAAILAAEVATISGHVHGNLTINAAKIELLRGARIDGDLTYTAPEELLFSREHVTVGGKLVHKLPPVVNTADILRAQMTYSAALFISALLTGGLFVACLPRSAGNAIRILRHSPLRCGIAGFFLASVVALIAVFAIPAVITAPFGLTLVAVMSVLLYLGNIVCGLALGGFVLRQQGPQPLSRAMIALTVGLGLLYAAKSIPLLGLYFTAFTWFTGAGALLLNLFHSQRSAIHPPELPTAAAPSDKA